LNIYAGSFSGPKKNEFVAARGHVLDLLRPDADTRKLHTIASTEAFGIIRSLLRFRLHGQEFDHLVVGSDSGKLAVLRFDSELGSWKTVQLETYGKTGCRRITPGQYLAGDPHGRAVMLSAIEKQKLVYLMNREEDNLVVAKGSPLEAHKSNTITFDTVALDTGFDNPMFAALELEYTESDADPTGEAAAAAQKMLVYYELDLGVNTMTRKWSREAETNSNILLAVPGGDSGIMDGPGGVLVLAENWVLFESSKQPSVRTPIPRRTDMPAERGLLITAATAHKQKAGNFFFMLQSEFGDLYKVTLDYEPASGLVNDVIVQYFDTIPPAVSLCVSRNGFLFAASEFGGHILYEFVSLGEGDDLSVAHALKINVMSGDCVELECPVFVPRALTNLVKVDDLPSLAPMTDMKVVIPPAVASLVSESGAPGALAIAAASVAGSGATAPYLAALCGRGPRSTLRVLREGLSVSEVAAAPMPGNPMSIFTVPTSTSGGADASIPQSVKYVVISFTNATLVLTVGEGLEEVSSKETGILDTVPTLAVQLLANESLLQVHPGGMRMITGAGQAKRVQEWKAPGKRTIEKVAANHRQVVASLSGGDIIYFELDEHGKLDERHQVSLGAEITAVTIGDVPEGRLRAPFCAVADNGNMVRVLSLDPSTPLNQVSAQALKTDATSLAMMTMRMGLSDAAPRLYIGLRNGVLIRVSVDPVTGVLSDPRSRFVGSRPVTLAAVPLGGGPACLALSSRPWVNYNHHGKFFTSPLSYETLEAAAPFVSEAVPDGIVAISGNSIRIFTVDRLGDTFNQKTFPLRYTPRRIAQLPRSSCAVLVESDHNTYSVLERIALAASEDGLLAEQPPPPPAAHTAAADDMEMEMDMDVEDEPSTTAADAPVLPEAAYSSLSTPGEQTNISDPQAEGVDIRRIGLPVPPYSGKWASAIRIVDLSAIASSDDAAILSTHHGATQHLVELSDDEAAFSVAVIPFHDHEGDTFVLVGAVRGLTFHPRKQLGACIKTYRVVEWDVPVDAAGSETSIGSEAATSTRRALRLQHVHTTSMDDIPYAITSFNGRALVGVGKSLRMYDLGKKRLLRKAECRGFPTLIQSIRCSVDRIFVADAAESVHVVKFKRTDNSFSIIADDVSTRHTTAFVPLDHDSVALGDKFGNVCILRLPDELNEDVDLGSSSTKLLWDGGSFHGSGNKFEQLAHFYVGEVITSLEKAALAGGSECILYSTINGSIGALLPFASKEELDFFTHLEIYLRNEQVSVVGRDHLSFRSLYVPCKVRLCVAKR
jgi:splicing factor 3B subunit 3